MADCDHYPRESWKLQVNKYGEEVMHCHKCGKYKAHYKDVEKKASKQIITQPAPPKKLEPGFFGNGD